MNEGPISGVKVHEHGVLLLDFDSGNSLVLDMKPTFGAFRFGVLANPEIFATADTDGNFIHWYRDGMMVAELGFGEIMKMVFGEAY
ncbi:MAG: DUF2442 domain-containing protein [Bacillota bacterium]|nr:DUF2442 domain-containing protein [Bacillota bacterium]